MTDFSLLNGFCSPLIAILTSTEVDRISEKNCLSFADMIAPFCKAQINIKDPIGNFVNSKIFLDLRDIRRSGFLLSHTVLPYVLYENVLQFKPNIKKDVFSQTFTNSFLYWFEPADHDFLRSFICCMFVVSVSDQDPLEELNKLQYQQHLQQHGGGESLTILSLAHCSSPKWFLPNILKYYILVQDISLESDEKANEVFMTIEKKYGSKNCHLLRINSSNSSQLPDPWVKVIEQRYCGLKSGLERARRAILEKSNPEPSYNSNQYIPSAHISRSSTTSSFSSISNSTNISQQNPFFITPSVLPQTTTQNMSHLSSNGLVSDYKFENTLNLADNDNTLIKNDFMVDCSTEHGQCLDAGDRERLKALIEEFVRVALIPFVEHQLVLQNETLANRRTIGRSLNSMRKWLSAASSTTTTSNSTVSYGVESSEWQTRCLADMAFQFGLYNFSYQLYQSLKKDFANDQAWLHHAGALEMTAFSNFLGFISSHLPSASGSLALTATLSPAIISQLQKVYPQRYMDNAINYYLNVCMQPMLALRCVLISVAILTRLELYSEAANHLILLNTLNLPDLFGAVLLERAANLFEMAKNYRRKAFYLVLAGYRYAKANMPQFALSSYQQVLPLLSEKNWEFAEDHILYTLSSQHDSLITSYLGNDDILAARFAIDCAGKLLRHYSKQSSEQQTSFLINYINLLKKHELKFSPFELAILKVDMKNIQVFYGDVLDSSRSFRTATFSPLSTFNSNKKINYYSVPPEEFRPCEGFENYSLSIGHPLDVWHELEKAVLKIHNSKLKNNNAEIQPLFSDEWTDNYKDSLIKCSPCFEPITVQLKLTNPLGIPLVLKNLRLGIVSNSFNNQNMASFLKLEILDQLKLDFFIENEIIDTVKTSESNLLNKDLSDNNSNCAVINLSFTPLQSIDLLTIERLDFDLCISNMTQITNENSVDNVRELNTINSFISLKIPGKRVFSTKEQRRTPTYLKDNRLNVCVTPKIWPFIKFRMAGNAGGRSSGHYINAYCNQMYQVITEIENVGKTQVHHFYLSTDRPELVSLSEEIVNIQNVENQYDSQLKSRWQLCESVWQPTSSLLASNGSTGILIHQISNINVNKPFLIGQKLSLRLAFRAPADPVKNHQISILFFYVDENGATRQFRYLLALSTQPLLSASLCLLNARNGLCTLNLKNLISTRDSILARIELQRLSTILLELKDIKQSKGDKFSITNISNLKQAVPSMDISCLPTLNSTIKIQPIINKNIVLESDQSQKFCLYLNDNMSEKQISVSSQELWISDFVADIPIWSHLLPLSEFLPQLIEGIQPALSSIVFSKTFKKEHNIKLENEIMNLSIQNNSLNTKDKTKQDFENHVYHLRFAVLWKAYITNSDGTVATVFGENFLSNPYISQDETFNKLFYTMPNSTNIFIASNTEIKSAQFLKTNCATLLS